MRNGRQTMPTQTGTGHNCIPPILAESKDTFSTESIYAQYFAEGMPAMGEESHRKRLQEIQEALDIASRRYMTSQSGRLGVGNSTQLVSSATAGDPQPPSADPAPGSPALSAATIVDPPTPPPLRQNSSAPTGTQFATGSTSFPSRGPHYSRRLTNKERKERKRARRGQAQHGRVPSGTSMQFNHCTFNVHHH